jgi:hypothetical protein
MKGEGVTHQWTIVELNGGIGPMRRLLCKDLQKHREWTRNTTTDNRNVQIGERRQLRNLCRNCARQLIVGQIPAKKHREWTRNTTTDNRNVQIVECRQLPDLCRNCASELIVDNALQQGARDGVRLARKSYANSASHNMLAPSIVQFVSELCH